jgi:hypothetical protein
MLSSCWTGGFLLKLPLLVLQLGISAATGFRNVLLDNGLRAAEKRSALQFFYRTSHYRLG